jgi:hypothetical protein
MARFRLRDGYDEKDLGQLILSIAEAAGPNEGAIDEKQKASLERKVRALVDRKTAKQIEFVYDTPDKIHVVVPFLGQQVYSDNNFANEAMGYIVIRGCGR